MNYRNFWSSLRSGAITLACLLLFGTVCEAGITNIVITTTTSPAFGGQSFGTVGQYQQLDGIAYGEIDPNDPLNAFIEDIGLAPLNANGKVAYSMNISILKPIDESKGNHVLLYDVVNRGSKLASSSFNVGGSATAAGDGFLENRGYTLVWSGWQGDLRTDTGLMTITVPVAHNPGGVTITGIVRSEISMLTAPIQTSPIEGGFATASVGYAPVSTDTTQATLTQRVHEADPRVPIPSNQWAYGSCNPTFPSVLPDVPPVAQYHLCTAGGFDPNHIYELIYTAQKPLVLGLGFAATRDFVSFLRQSTASTNPLAGVINHTLIYGESQSGRFVRTFVDLGFNQDEQQLMVFDGALPQIASCRIPLNARFGQPGRGSGLQHTEHEYAGCESPMTWGSYDDPLANVTGDILQRCSATNTCPKFTAVFSSIEYWQSGMSSDTTDDFGLQDLPIPANVRLYHFASTQHSGYSPIGVVPPVASPVCQQLPDANSYTYNIRAILVALTNWVVNNQLPPASRYGRIIDGTLVGLKELNFPIIPNVSENLGVILSIRSLYNRGPNWDGFNVSGYESIAPPLRIADYTMLVPQVDADGNDIDGVRSITLQAPLGTYTGWNTRAAGYGQGDACDLTGSFIPFAPTLAARLASGDPRRSIAERYPTVAAYNQAVVAAANNLLAQGFLLPGDYATAIAEAEAQAAGSSLLPTTPVQAAVSISDPLPLLTATPGNFRTKEGTITVSNTGSAPLTITANPTITETAGAGFFSLVAPAFGTPCMPGLVVAAGGNCTIGVQYYPTPGTETSTAFVTITDSGAATSSQNSAPFIAN
jgi:hypothetical protein